MNNNATKNNNEPDLQTIERFLTEVENSYDTSYEMQLKRKIAGLFENRKAYEILINSYFGYRDGVFRLKFRKKALLTTFEEERLKNAIKSVYGNDIDIQIVNINKSRTNASNNNQINNTDQTNKNELQIFNTLEQKYNPLIDMDKNSSWYKIRKGLIEEIGIKLDKVWFAKVRIKEDKDR